MLVGERMKKPVITINPEMPIMEALDLMRRERIRRTPVVKDGKLVGIISDKDLLNASPSPAIALSVWEMHYLVSKIQVQDIMTVDVLTVTEDTPLEEAARIMADNKIGGLPVMLGEDIVGIITETDLFKIFLELLGAREFGVRVTALIKHEHGQLAKLTQALANHGGNFLAFAQFCNQKQSNCTIVFKVKDIELDKVKTVITPLVENIIDIRTTS